MALVAVKRALPYKEYAHDYVGIWGQLIQILGQISEAILRLPKFIRTLIAFVDACI